MQNRFKSFKFLVFSFWFLASAFAEVNRDTIHEIGSIRTAGNHSIESYQILSKVRSRAGQLFNAATAAEDAKRIAELPGVEYAYYNQVTADGKIQLTFVVVGKNIVRTIVFLGNRKVKAKTLRSKLDFKVGDYFDPILAQSSAATLNQFYKKKGYAFARIDLDQEKAKYGEVVFKIDEGPRVKIKAVRFRDNVAIKTGQLKKIIKTKTRKFFLWSRYYNEERVADDVTRLQNLYQKRGFLDAAVTAQRDFTKNKSKVRITFVIEEGAVYTVQKVVLTGNRHFREDRLRAQLKLEQGQVYSEQKSDSDVERLLRLYRESGFIDAEVQKSRRFVSANKVSVEFEVAEGRRFRIGQINITGNQQVQDKVVRRILDEYDFQPGQWYNADIARGDGSGELEKIIQRTVLTGRNGAVITPIGDQPGQKDAQVNIVEGQTGMIMVGAGGATENGVIGQLVFEQMNFNRRY